MSERVPDLPEEKSKKRTAVEVASEGAVGAIPFVGSLLVATLSAYFSATQENRTREWMEEMAEVVQALLDRAVRWYLRYGLSYRKIEELLGERGVDVDHVTIYRWVQLFTPEFVEAAWTRRHVPGDRWFVDETCVQVGGHWTCLYRAIDQHGQVMDVWLSRKRDLTAARALLSRALASGEVPVEVTTDRAPSYPRALDELIRSALHTTEQYANNRVEANDGRLKARLRPMRGLKRYRSACALAAGRAFVQNLRRGHYETLSSSPTRDRHRVAFDELALAVWQDPPMAERCTGAHTDDSKQQCRRCTDHLPTQPSRC